MTDINTVFEAYRSIEVRRPVPCPACGAMPENLPVSLARGVLHDLDCAYEAWRCRKQRMSAAQAA